MRWKFPAGAVLALVFLVPAAPAAAQAAQPGLNETCQTVERTVFRDFRELISIDLDTATDEEVNGLAKQVLAAATAENLPVLPKATQDRLEGTAEDLRAFLKTGWRNAWTADLRISVGRTMSRGGGNVKAAATKALDDGTFDALLAYLNDGLYVARVLDCEHSLPQKPLPTAKPSASTTVTPVPSGSAGQGTPGSGDGSEDGGAGGGLPVTGSGTAAVAGIGGALLILGFSSYLIGRRRRSRFVA